MPVGESVGLTVGVAVDTIAVTNSLVTTACVSIPRPLSVVENVEVTTALVVTRLVTSKVVGKVLVTTTDVEPGGIEVVSMAQVVSTWDVELGTSVVLVG